jgi:hypothetical protein
LAVACSSPRSPPEKATTDAAASPDVQSLDARGGALDAQGESLDAQGGSAADHLTGDSADAVVDTALGLRATYFRRHGALTLERVDPTVDFVWGMGGPVTSVDVDHFSAR